MFTPFQIRARQVLSQNPFFRNLPEECMRYVERTAVRKGENLFGACEANGFSTSEANGDFYALVGGQLKLVSEDADGRQLSLGLVAPGELVGEMGLSHSVERRSTFVALAHSEVATLRRRDLEPLMERCPELHVALLEASAEAALGIAQRLSERLADEAFLSIEARVEKALADCARRFGERVECGTRVLLRQQDLADILGLSRESVSKILTSPAMQAKLDLGRGSIVLLGS